MGCEWVPFPVVRSIAIARLNYHPSGRVCECPDHRDETESVWLFSIAALLDERRLSSMAAHPSAAGDWYWSPQLIDDPVIDEEFPE